jgi:hypothetical protein
MMSALVCAAVSPSASVEVAVTWTALVPPAPPVMSVMASSKSLTVLGLSMPIANAIAPESFGSGLSSADESPTRPSTTPEVASV